MRECRKEWDISVKWNTTVFVSKKKAEWLDIFAQETYLIHTLTNPEGTVVIIWSVFCLNQTKALLSINPAQVSLYVKDYCKTG